ncbi:MAG: hypothetical protein K2Y37_00790 [Pirellulales bacterium]|nr:hypothetical protein [Pirellulales bacterium]
MLKRLIAGTDVATRDVVPFDCRGILTGDLAMKKRWPMAAILLTLAGGALLASVAVVGQQPGEDLEPNRVGKFMRAKLEHAERLLEGLTTEDFDMLVRESQALVLLSEAAEWQVLETADYAAESSEFRRAADGLKKAARDKNLDAAALRYVDLTLKCVHCHKYVRSVRLANLNDDRRRRDAAE